MLLFSLPDALAIMYWPHLDAMVPELVPFRQALQQSKDATNAEIAKSNCPNCKAKITNQFEIWCSDWLVRLNAFILRRQDVKEVVLHHLNAIKAKT